MSLGKFKDDFNKEREATPRVIEWVSKILGLSKIEEANQYLQKYHDIDFSGEYKNGKIMTIENKIRFTDYDDILIETISNTNKSSPGWIYSSKANCLAYVFQLKGIIEKGYIFDLPKLQAWWKRIGSRNNYLIKFGKTLGLYKTQNVVVPETHIPLNCVIYHPKFGLINPPSGDEIDQRLLR